jgi:hypothetical protein
MRSIAVEMTKKARWYQGDDAQETGKGDLERQRGERNQEGPDVDVHA